MICNLINKKTKLFAIHKYSARLSACSPSCAYMDTFSCVLDKKMTQIIYFIVFLIDIIMLLQVYICLMMRLWEFQNGKMSLYNPKIDQDTARNVKI